MLGPLKSKLGDISEDLHELSRTGSRWLWLQLPHDNAQQDLPLGSSLVQASYTPPRPPTPCPPSDLYSRLSYPDFIRFESRATAEASEVFMPLSFQSPAALCCLAAPVLSAGKGEYTEEGAKYPPGQEGGYIPG